MALFRLVEPEVDGGSIFIDGVDITKIGLCKLNQLSLCFLRLFLISFCGVLLLFLLCSRSAVATVHHSAGPCPLQRRCQVRDLLV